MAVKVTVEWMDGALETVDVLGRQELGRGYADYIDRTGLASWLTTAINDGTTGDQIREGMHTSQEGQQYRERLANPPPLSPITIEGSKFYTNGKQWTYKFASFFRGFERYLAGEDLNPALSQLANLGANGVRTFFRYNGGIGHLEPTVPGYYNVVGGYRKLLEGHNLYLHAECLADCQNGMSDFNTQREHVARMASSLAGSPTLMSLGNEWVKNGFDPQRFEYPGGEYLLWARGSGLGDAPPWGSYSNAYYSGWDWYDWHGRRDYPKVIFSNEDMWYVEEGITGNGTRLDHPRPIVGGEDIGFGPDNISGRRSNDPELAAAIAGTSLYFGRGACFHSDMGIQATQLGGRTLECAQAFYAAF